MGVLVSKEISRATARQSYACSPHYRDKLEVVLTGHDVERAKSIFREMGYEAHAFVAIGIGDTNKSFVAETAGKVLVEFRNYDPSYFGDGDPEDIEVDDNGRKYFVMKSYG